MLRTSLALFACAVAARSVPTAEPGRELSQGQRPSLLRTAHEWLCRHSRWCSTHDASACPVIHWAGVYDGKVISDTIFDEAAGKMIDKFPEGADFTAAFECGVAGPSSYEYIYAVEGREALADRHDPSMCLDMGEDWPGPRMHCRDTREPGAYQFHATRLAPDCAVVEARVLYTEYRGYLGQLCPPDIDCETTVARFDVRRKQKPAEPCEHMTNMN